MDSKNVVGYLSLVRQNPNFRNLWFGQIISLLGDWFNLIASASLIGKLSGSGLAVGGLFALRMIAPFLISPIAGVAADRFNRKHLLIVADVSRTVIVFGFLLIRSPQHLWLLYTLTALQLAIGGIFFPTRSAILPDIVSRRELGAANAISSATWSIMLALGAALGGLVAGGWGIYPAFAIDALTFLLSAFFIARIRYQSIRELHSSENSLSIALHKYTDGLRFLKQHPDILAIVLHKAAFSLTASGAFQVVQVAIAEEIFVIGEGGGISLGILYAVVGLGTGIGPILVRRFTGDRHRALRLALALAYPIASLGTIIAATLGSFGIVLLGVTLRGIGGGINWVFSSQLLLDFVPEEFRGRVFATEFAVFSLSSAFSASAGGWAIDLPGLGIDKMLLWMAGLTLIPGVFWSLWLLFGHPQGPSIKRGRSTKPRKRR